MVIVAIQYRRRTAKGIIRLTQREAIAVLANGWPVDLSGGARELQVTQREGVYRGGEWGTGAEHRANALEGLEAIADTWEIEWEAWSAKWGVPAQG